MDTGLAARVDRVPDLRSTLLVAAGLSFGPTVAIGFARFAYALLLPGMRADLGWTFAQAGAMNTANALGYLLGALLATVTARRFGARPAFAYGIVVTAAALLLSAVTTSFPVLLVLRLAAGVAGAVTFVAGGGLVAHLGRSVAQRSALLLSLYVAGGGGLGILISALAVNPLLVLSPHAWRLGWATLGGLSMVALLAARPALRRVDEILGVPPTAVRAATIEPLRFTFASYTLFGAGYIAYMTFIIALLRAEGVGAGVSVFWALLGLAAMSSPAVWGPVLERLPGGRGLALTMLVVAIGAALPVANASTAAALLSALVFGGSFLNVVTAVTTVARRILPPHGWTTGIAALTVVFAIGQCIGPLLSGVLADRSGGVRLGLALSAGLLLLGALVALGQRE